PKRWSGGSNSYNFIGIDALPRTTPCADVASLRPQNAERLFDHHVPARERADRHDQRRRHGHAEQIDRRDETPVYFQSVLADRPRQRDSGGGSERAREQTQHAVFDQQRGDDQLSFGAERLEDRRFVEAVEFSHRDRADQNQQATQEDKSTDERDGQ